VGYDSASFFQVIRILIQALLTERARKKEMRFMKKFLSLGLVAVMGVGLAAGCKKETPAAEAPAAKSEAPAVVQETGTTSTTTTGTTTSGTATTTTTTTATTATTTPASK
jgi:hypothetical protein